MASDSAPVSPVTCARGLIERDGAAVFLTRGLGATLAREVPSYIFYFLAYELVKGALGASPLVPTELVPLLGGGAAGVAAWLPVYPIDCVKTHLQTSEGCESFAECAVRLYRDGGVGAFWDGLSAKLARAVVNSATTFYVFDLVRNANACGMSGS